MGQSPSASPPLPWIADLSVNQERDFFFDEMATVNNFSSFRDFPMAKPEITWSLYRMRDEKGDFQRIKLGTEPVIVGRSVVRDVRVSRNHMSITVSEDGTKVYIKMLGQNGAIIVPDMSRVVNTRSAEAMVVGETREIFDGDKFNIFFLHILVYHSGDVIYPTIESPENHALKVFRWEELADSPQQKKRPIKEDRDGPPKKKMHPNTLKFLKRNGYFDFML